MPESEHARVFWGAHRGRVRLTFHDWDAITHQSVVHISASEGDPPITTGAPRRFVGEAINIGIDNIAPFDGGVTFIVHVHWHEMLNIWTDITVFNPGQRLVQGSVPFPPPR